MIAVSPENLLILDCFLKLTKIAPHFDVHLKLEGLSATGSIKVKAALHMLNQMEASGRLRKGMRIIESSSGNLGLALSMICAARGYPFTCVTDPNISQHTASLIKAYGGDLLVVTERDASGGFLQTRIDLIKSMLEDDPTLIWVNQYENEANVDAHYRMTGPEILTQFPRPDYVFIGVGTSGTIGGVSRYLREHAPKAIIIAIDTVGSVTFGKPPAKRLIPGLGTSSPPPIRYHAQFDELLMIDECDTIHMCHELASQGVLLGGSSGTVLSGVRQWSRFIPNDSCVVAISPDMGNSYVETIYSPEWVQKNYGSRFDAGRKNAEDYRRETNRKMA